MNDLNIQDIKNNLNKRVSSKLSASSFKLTIDKTMLKTPHYIMSRVYDIIENRPSVQSGLDMLNLFVFSDFGFKSDDEKSVMYANKWWEARESWLLDEIKAYSKLEDGIGTTYVEPIYNDNGAISNFYHIPDPSKIYKNTHCIDEEVDYWIMEVPLNVRTYEGINPKYYLFNYLDGEVFGTKHVYGIGLPKSKLIQFKTVGGKDPNYGWGMLSSAVDNDDVLREILKNWSLMAKYRALARKIIGVYNHGGEPVDGDELQNLQSQFMNLEEEDSMLLNKRIDSTDLSFTGQDNSMQGEASTIMRENSSSLVPSFMTAFSQDGSMATAREAKVPFGLKLQSMMKRKVIQLNKLIIEEGMKKDAPWLADDLTVDLGPIDLYDFVEKANTYSMLYNTRLITFNEFRRALGLDAVEGGDKWGSEPPLDRVTIQKQEAERLKESLENDKVFKESINSIKSNVKFKESVGRVEVMKNSDELKKVHSGMASDKQISFYEKFVGK